MNEKNKPPFYMKDKIKEELNKAINRGLCRSEYVRSLQEKIIHNEFELIINSNLLLGYLKEFNQ